MARAIWMLGFLLWGMVASAQQGSYPAPAEADFILRDLRFENGETLPELRLHYYTLGSLQRDDQGTARNAVLVLHGTGGAGQGFLNERFAGVLFGKGQLLDAERYYIVLPDNIGHGKSSKPSDGLRGKFPHYNYNDMVDAQCQLLNKGLGVNHLRLVIGTSMGGMHSWVWATRYPDFMDAAMPLASLPVQIAGRNRLFRRMVIDSIRNDPGYNNGDYHTQPCGMRAAVYTLLVMTSVPLQWQKQYPTREAVDEFLDEQVRSRLARTDANDMLYQFDASRDYDPSPLLERIQVPLVAINSADDQVNPPELRVAEREIQRVKKGRFVLLTITDQTRGHGTHSLPELWKHHLARLLEESRPGKE